MSEHKILVVDDDREIRETVIEVLADAGYVAVGACDGADALEQLRGPDDDWCVVLLDLMMPNMDGRAFRAQQLKDPTIARVPVVIISATADVEQAAKELEVAAHCTKPLPLSKLVSLVQQFCPRAA